MKHQIQKDEEDKIAKRRKEAERTLRDQIRHAFRDLSPDHFDEATSRISATVRETSSSLK